MTKIRYLPVRAFVLEKDRYQFNSLLIVDRSAKVIVVAMRFRRYSFNAYGFGAYGPR